MQQVTRPALRGRPDYLARALLDTGGFRPHLYRLLR